jgi:hypothetical protein
VYSFQPVEINDPNLSIYERSVPIDYKRETLAFELPKAFSEKAPNNAKQNQMLIKEQVEESRSPRAFLRQSSQQKENPDPNNSEHKYTTLKSEFDEHYHNIMDQSEIKGGNKDWYRHLGKIVNHMQVAHDIGFGEIMDHAIRHMIDMLLIPDKLVLASHFYSKIREEDSMDEIEQAIKEYLDTKIITSSRQTGIFLAENKKWTIYVQDLQTRVWTEAEPEDIRFFEQSRHHRHK